MVASGTFSQHSQAWLDAEGFMPGDKHQSVVRRLLRAVSSLKWRTWSRALIVAQTIAVAITALGLVLTARQVADANQVQSASFALDFSKRLDTPEYAAILSAAYEGAKAPVIAEYGRGGKSKKRDVNTLLNHYDDLALFHKTGLIDRTLVDNMFCPNLEGLMKNADVNAFIAEARRIPPPDPTLFDDVTWLSKQCCSWDKCSLT
jgi:hypothetical protein